ncbi:MULTISPECIES: heptaprenylglyceryl phosphate synthase [Priestia]|jgi:putative glycerol-1-phosphate prenyltransferase|uniref:Heptaprenylglyceryl phosphate synthase n=1 Tax=Priestia megaterium TaxID=1404 RepID=A0A2C2PRV3_PRIMG|nr:MULTISPECIES: heptaprenylglyceryl phosphate synthase [Priestia]AVX06473.1 heptaprenylglyceryl phosphate synthase [Bacillus sp. Y-01]KRF48035.1 heptaprenylglyceryl phosphate synthase [Bacillus sp. Soil531]MBZ5482069.1 heptaprenylglyceryl phosphate synthase [Bacillus sp. T_4]MCF6799270.1 heptaprenylglyceryl phosphate synthase [Bacillus sp. ET1]MDH6656762.1 putative glycerol-1-phosphate prenyltransferase [Bacillus sp. PvP124]MDP9579015.1 putative glycerol-1-phosphate prenyltransferase [Bacill
MYDIKEWRHVFKLDPNKEISDADLEKICESGTDAVLVGGSDGVTLDNVLQLLMRIRRYTVPCALEVSTIDSVTPGFDSYFIPTVLNSKDPKWIVDLHHGAMKEYGEIMDWDEIFVEGYCVLNPEAKVAALTEAKTDLNTEDVVAYARMAERMFHLPVFYLEYSGTYGDPELVAEVKNSLNETKLFYGGGIETKEQASEMGELADTVIVGNVIYTNLAEALKTVKAVKKNIAQ